MDTDIFERSTVTISKEEYESLLHDSSKLNCLMNAGVDNWEWYGEALRELYEDEDCQKEAHE